MQTMKEEFYLPSSCEGIDLRGIMWQPEGEVKAILQISHGMAEHIERYDEFAMFLRDLGYCVVGHDHIGHGKTAKEKEERGHIDSKGGNQFLIEDMHLIRKKLAAMYPKAPYFMLGHSMGSTLLRQYILEYGEGLDGIILSGPVAKISKALLSVGKCLAKAIGKIKGADYRSKLLYNMTLGSYSKQIKDDDVGSWVTKDKEKAKEYADDELSDFIFTASGYYAVFDGIGRLHDKEASRKTPHDLPIYIVSGKEDPVGGFGEGVEKIHEEYKKDGAKNVDITIYEEGRHEMLNEVNRQEVYQDIAYWMEKTITLNLLEASLSILDEDI